MGLSPSAVVWLTFFPSIFLQFKGPDGSPGDGGSTGPSGSTVSKTCMFFPVF